MYAIRSYYVLWGFAATAILAAILASCQGLGLTRMSMPFILGTMITPDRDRAMLWGTLWSYNFV